MCDRLLQNNMAPTVNKLLTTQIRFSIVFDENFFLILKGTLYLELTIFKRLKFSC